MKRVVFRNVKRSLNVIFRGVLLLSAVHVVSCSAWKASEPPPPPPPLEHTISYLGETLGKIAKWYTGNVNNVSVILEANPGLDPRKLTLGKVVLIPRSLITKEQPLPKSYVDGSYAKTGSSAKKRVSLTPSEKVSQTPEASPQVSPSLVQPAATPAPSPVVLSTPENTLSAPSASASSLPSSPELKGTPSGLTEETATQNLEEVSVGDEKPTGEVTMQPSREKLSDMFKNTKREEIEILEVPPPPAPSRPDPLVPETLDMDRMEKQIHQAVEVTPQPSVETPTLTSEKQQNAEQRRRRSILEEMLDGK